MHCEYNYIYTFCGVLLIMSGEFEILLSKKLKAIEVNSSCVYINNIMNAIRRFSSDPSCDVS